MRSGRGVQVLAQQRVGALPPGGATAVLGSSERMPFAERFLKVRPMAITSPTDFICVPSVVSAPGNFSNCHLGIFTTT